MPKIHIVKQGEYLSGIAKVYGFHSYEKIWHDPANAKLKEERKNPNVLFPGDPLVVPDKEEKHESRATDARHRFQMHVEKLRLRVVIKNESAEAVANADYTLVVESEVERKKTDGAGALEKSIPRGAQQGQLLLKNDQFAIDLNVPVAIGHLDPVDTVTGQIGRLNNLGYDAGDVQEPVDAAAKEQFRSAVEEFQCNEALAVDGKCGPQTQAKLKQVHGC
jgi:hypothetical protein